METHSAVLVFLEGRVYKLKKPVDLGFLDFRDPTTRERACRAEVALNRRLAPDVYLGVADVVGPDGVICDHMVVMRALPDERRLATLVSKDADISAHIRRLARLLAVFHERCEIPADAADLAGQAALRRLWLSSLDPMEGYAGGVLDAARLASVATLALGYLDGRAKLFAERLERGRVRDGHGDLLAEGIFLLPDGPRVLDCLEFDRRLRIGDVVNCLAFLAMDLERLGGGRWASQLWADYREFTAETHPPSLEHFYLAYRALVRCKVACIRDAQGEPARAEAGRLLDLAADHLGVAVVRLVLIGGLPGTGKSTVAGGLAERLPATVLSSDVVRKQLFGRSPELSAGGRFERGACAPTCTGRTYAELLARAGTALRRGETVVLDATWRDPAWRAAAARLAEQARADLIAVECVAPPDAARARIRAREGGPSEATEAVYDAMAAGWLPWPAAHKVDTTRSPDQSVDAAVAAVVPPTLRCPAR